MKLFGDHETKYLCALEQIDCTRQNHKRIRLAQGNLKYRKIDKGSCKNFAEQQKWCKDVTKI